MQINASHGVILCILVSCGTLRCPGVFSGLAIHTETKPFSVHIEIEYFMYDCSSLITEKDHLNS